MLAVKTSVYEYRNQSQDDIQVVVERQTGHLFQERALLMHHTHVTLQSKHRHDVPLKHERFLSKHVQVSVLLIRQIQPIDASM